MHQIVPAYPPTIKLKTVSHGHRWRNCLSGSLIAWGLCVTVPVCVAQDLNEELGERAAPAPSSSSPVDDGSTGWHYGAYLDVSYIVNFNFPDNDLWRSRSTAIRFPAAIA